MWIMLTTKLPTNPSPPKLSMFWSVPWPDDVNSKYQKRICIECGQEVENPHEEDGSIYKNKRYTRMTIGQCGCEGGSVFATEQTRTLPDKFGLLEPNWIGARMIRYKGSDIRVFPHEFSVMKLENMRLYILGSGHNSQSHELVKDEIVSSKMESLIMDTELKAVYDAALLDGCTEEQAYLTVSGQDITDEEVEFAPLGWYRCMRHYAELFCYENEMEE